jgi:flagellar motor switch protein FliM
MTLTADHNLGAKLRSASRVEAERLPRLKAIATAWAESLKDWLARDFSSEGHVEFAGASALRIGAGTAEPATIAVLASSSGWPHPALVLADERFADLVPEFLFGGDGTAKRTAGRRASEMDLRFCTLVVEKTLALGNAALAPVMDVALDAERTIAHEAGARLAEIFADEPADFIQLDFRFTLGRAESHLRVALPESVVALHRRKLDRLPEAAAPAIDPDWAREIEERLQHADMQLTALLDEKPMTLGDIAGLAVGQTIVLGTRVDGLITVECEDRRLFRGRMGRGREAYLVRIEETIDPTEEFIDDILAD